MSLLKYLGEQDTRHGGKLFWSQNTPGGLPFRGTNAPTLTEEELQRDVQVALDFHQEFFDLSNSDSAKRYQWVMDRVVNNAFKHHFIDRHVDHATQKTTVYIEWSQRYAQLSPASKSARSQGNAISIPQNPGINIPLAGMQPPNF